jgi:hypothetical protein
MQKLQALCFKDGLFCMMSRHVVCAALLYPTPPHLITVLFGEFQRHSPDIGRLCACRKRTYALKSGMYVLGMHFSTTMVHVPSSRVRASAITPSPRESRIIRIVFEFKDRII